MWERKDSPPDGKFAFFWIVVLCIIMGLLISMAGGCNTIRGVGLDLQEAGEAMGAQKGANQ